MALEMHEGTARCGFVRNPLAYLFKAVHPDADVPVLDAPPAIEHGYQLSVRFATVLGFGKGCDADDDEDTAAWSAGSSATQS
ncbi:hypothetical protein [Curvibacter delicatus]|jgi:hypothetical protein|uniref:hypothetical protein n=1 Tax=Curvibacter delicatus TaxID=80879 RepID=UPI0012EDEC9F|nr:hypothetical protein [Curvibacter delicatus]